MEKNPTRRFRDQEKKPIIIVVVLPYAEVCNELAGPPPRPNAKQSCKQVEILGPNQSWKCKLQPGMNQNLF